MVSSKTTPSGPIWASDTYNWCTAEGLARLQDLLREKVPYEITERQLSCTAKLLMGQHVACVWATGEGKSSVFYLYSLVRPATMSIVVSPTNALESDMVKRLNALKIPALAVNHEALIAASSASPPRDLWKEVKDGAVNIVLLSPEMLLSGSFKSLVQSSDVRPRIALFCIDECHLVDEWGADFRKAYGRIGDTIPWLPEWTTRLALTATLEPGRQTAAVMKALAFRDNNFHFDRRDCERRNIDLVFCTMQYAYTTDEFHDLDWVVHPDIERASDIPKTLIYCETIDLGHRLTTYLRGRLSPTLRTHRTSVVRHAHSLNCPHCKTDILDGLCQSGDDRTTAIVVATDVLGVGMDVPDCDRVICFPTPSSNSSMIQRIGRTSRARDRHGTAYVYLKKADVEAVTAYLRHSPNVDHRILPSTLASTSVACDDEESPTDQKRVSKKLTARIKSDAFIKNVSLWAVLSAYIQRVCLVRQINVIQGNPGVDRNCGRCSSCCPHLIPPLPPPTSMLSTLPSGDSTNTPSPTADHVPISLKLKPADVEYLVRQLDEVAFKIRDKGPDCDDDLFIGYKAFLGPRWISKITNKFMLITSKDVLKSRLKGWEYWDAYGSALWSEVEPLVGEMDRRLKLRHEDSKRLRREKHQEEVNVRKQVVNAGLGGVKRVRLLVRPPTVATSSSLPPAAVDKENLLSGDDTAYTRPSTPETDVLEPLFIRELPTVLSPKRPQLPLNASDLMNTPPRRRKRQRNQ